MATPKEPKCKYCRRAGEKLFIKGERCHTPKCAAVRKPYPPGQHGKRRRRLSDYGRQLKEKQKIRWVYGVSEKKLRRYFREAQEEEGAVNDVLIRRLEMRLDNVVFRLGLADSRATARQLVSHRHITVNGRSVNIPGMQVSVGDEIAVSESSKSTGAFENLDGRLKKYDPPAWLQLDKDNWSGTVTATPSADDSDAPAEVQMAIEFYSR